MDFPRALKVVQLSTGVTAKVILSRPKAYYSRAGSVRLVAPDLAIDPVTGLATVTVNFPTPLKDANWIPGAFTFLNYQDALVDMVFLQALMVLQQGQNSFKVLLSAQPPTGNYIMNWSIAEAHNP
jgi:hypothetical protein